MKYTPHIVIAAVGITLLAAIAPRPNPRQEDTRPVPVTSGVQYEFIGRYDVDRLNQILTKDTPKFTEF